MNRLTWECELDGFTDIGLRDGVTVDTAICRLSAYEDTGLEPEEILRILDAYGRGMTLRTESAQRLEIVKDIQTDRLRELAEADREGRVKIEQKARRCPRCGKMTLFPRIDWQFYYCYSCKTQFSKSDFEAALRREQDGQGGRA